VTTLNEKEELLVRTLRALPPETAEKVMTWASQLSDLASGRPVEWSDTWTGQDLEDARAASLRNFDEQESALGSFGDRLYATPEFRRDEVESTYELSFEVT
jgi:hypothetical protein